MIDMIKDLQRISAKYLVITINKNYYTICTTVISNSLVNIWAGGHPLLVFNHNNIYNYVIFGNPLLDQLVGMVCGSIINDYYLEIFVLKIYHRLKIVLISKVSSVIESWYDYAKRKFRKIKIILFRKSIFLLLQILLYLLINMDIRMWYSVVVHGLEEGSLSFIHRHLKTSVQNLLQIRYFTIIKSLSNMIVDKVYSQLQIFIFVVYIFYHFCRIRIAQICENWSRSRSCTRFLCLPSLLKLIQRFLQTPYLLSQLCQFFRIVFIRISQLQKIDFSSNPQECSKKNKDKYGDEYSCKDDNTSIDFRFILARIPSPVFIYSSSHLVYRTTNSSNLQRLFVFHFCKLSFNLTIIIWIKNREKSHSQISIKI